MTRPMLYQTAFNKLTERMTTSSACSEFSTTVRLIMLAFQESKNKMKSTIGNLFDAHCTCALLPKS
jgi:hypothetical protein